ncbi:Protein nedd1, partial [Irineochytrium annulatum]
MPMMLGQQASSSAALASASPPSDGLISVSSGAVLLWDVAASGPDMASNTAVPTLGCQQRLKVSPPLQSVVPLDAAWSYNCKHFATCGTDNAVSIHDRNGKIVDIIPGLKTAGGHKDAITTIAVTADESAVVSGSKAGEMRSYSLVRNVSTELKSPFKQKLQSITKTAVSLFNRSHVAACGDEGGIAIWDLNSTLKPTLLMRDAHIAPIRGIAFSPCNRSLLASVGLDRRLKVYNKDEKGKLILEFEADSPLTSLSVNNDFLMAAGTIQGKILVYDLRGKKPLLSFFASEASAITSLAFLPPQHLQENVHKEPARSSDSGKNSSSSLASQHASSEQPLSNAATMARLRSAVSHESMLKPAATGGVESGPPKASVASLKERFAAVQDKGSNSSFMEMFSPVKGVGEIPCLNVDVHLLTSSCGVDKVGLDDPRLKEYRKGLAAATSSSSLGKQDSTHSLKSATSGTNVTRGRPGAITTTTAAAAAASVSAMDLFSPARATSLQSASTANAFAPPFQPNRSHLSSEPITAETTAWDASSPSSSPLITTGASARLSDPRWGVEGGGAKAEAAGTAGGSPSSRGSRHLAGATTTGSTTTSSAAHLAALQESIRKLRDGEGDLRSAITMPVVRGGGGGGIVDDARIGAVRKSASAAALREGYLRPDTPSMLL